MLLAIVAIGAVALILFLRSSGGGGIESLPGPLGALWEEEKESLPTYAEPVRGTATGKFTGSLADAQFRDPKTITGSSSTRTIPPPATSSTITSQRSVPGPATSRTSTSAPKTVTPTRVGVFGPGKV